MVEFKISFLDTDEEPFYYLDEALLSVKIKFNDLLQLSVQESGNKQRQFLVQSAARTLTQREDYRV